MTDIIDNIMAIYQGMDNDEKKELVEAIGLAAIGDGLYPNADANPTANMPKTIKATLGKPVPAGGGKKKGWKGKSLPYWVKKITNINPAQKGFHAWESEWVNDTSELAEGEVVLVGWKFEPKKYYLCKADIFNRSAKIKLPDGTELNNLELFREAEKMGDLKEKAKELLGIT